MADSKVTISINGQDNASKVFEKFAQTVGTFLTAAQGFDKLKTGFNDVTTASNRTENALIGLSSVANAFGAGATQATQAAQDLTKDGLMSINEAATSLKNLLAAGFGLDQAINLMDRFKDSAAFGRQGALGFGEAIQGATEGIKNGNSILVDNAGVTKNLSVMLEEAGYSAQDLMKASTDAGVRQAIFNGIMRETAPQVGDAAKAAKTYSGAQAQLGTTLFNVKAQAGDMVKIVAGPLTTGLAQWVAQNKDLVISAAFAGAAIVGFITLLAGAAGLVAAVGSVVAVLGGPLTIVLVGIAALLGTVVFSAMQKMQQKMADTAKTTVDGSKAIGTNAQQGFGKASKAAQDLAKQLADIDRSMQTAERDFKESLAKMIQDHEEKRDALKSQIDQETTNFSDANTQRLEDFTKSQQDMKTEHESKVKDIEDQINQETAKGEFANQERLADLIKRLNAENVSYNQHFGDLQKQYDDDVAKAKKQYDDKLLQLQKELNDEVNLLSKHAGDKKAIQGIMLLDEIDALKRSHNEQMASYTRQKNDAIAKAAETTRGIAGQFNSLPGQINPNSLNGIGNQLGSGMANALKQSFKDAIKDLGAWIWNTLKQDFQDIFNGDLGKGLSIIGQALGKKYKIPGFAGGTDYAPGGTAWVGENGPELVDLPRGSKVHTAGESAGMAGGSQISISIGEVHNHTPEAAAEFWAQAERGQELALRGMGRNRAYG